MRKVLICLMIPLVAGAFGWSAAYCSSRPSVKIGGSLNMVVWEGYADNSFVKPFEAQTGCQVHATAAGSSDEMFTKIRSGGGSAYDLVSASGDASLRLIHTGSVQPVDISKIPNWKDLA